MVKIFGSSPSRFILTPGHSYQTQLQFPCHQQGLGKSQTSDLPVPRSQSIDEILDFFHSTNSLEIKSHPQEPSRYSFLFDLWCF
jgi:hypothetical protein